MEQSQSLHHRQRTQFLAAPPRIARCGLCFDFLVILVLGPKFYPPQCMATLFRNSAYKGARHHHTRTHKLIELDSEGIGITFCRHLRHCKHRRFPLFPCLLFPSTMGFSRRRVLYISYISEVTYRFFAKF